MFHGTFHDIKRIINALGFYRHRPGFAHSDGAVLAVYFWSVLHDRPVFWACDPDHWAPGAWRADLPSQSCMSRRLRSAVVQRCIDQVERIARPLMPNFILVGLLDGKSLEIALHSRDRQSGKGRGRGHVARGYKLHALVSAAGGLLWWRLSSLDIDERVMARRALRDVQHVCYVAADANYHSTELFALAEGRGMQLVAPRKASHQGRGLRKGKEPHHPARLRSIELLERGESGFGPALMAARRGIERFFAQLTNFGGGLTCLPPWVRGYRRTKAWVQAKLIIALLRGSIPAPNAEGGA